MMKFRVLWLALPPLVCIMPVRAQNELPVISRVERVIKNKEPEWKYIRGICTCPPLIPEQKSVSVTEWERQDKRGIRESIDIEFYDVASAEEASQWMLRFDRGEVAEGWKIKKYDLGEQAYSLTYRDGSRTSIIFGNSNIVVMVSGEHSEDVERFARYVNEEMRAS
jgi:hypothetical protein